MVLVDIPRERGRLEAPTVADIPEKIALGTNCQKRFALVDIERSIRAGWATFVLWFFATEF